MRLAIPLYAHPTTDPLAWFDLAGLLSLLTFAVVNVDSGPGQDPDPSYVRLVGPLAEQGVPLVGYVPTGWGARPLPAILDDVRCWRDRYGVTGVFLDEVPADRERLGWTGVAVEAARQAGMAVVVVNPGVPAPEALLAAADFTCTFEGPASAYRALTPPPGTVLGGPGTVHLVHSTPADQLDGVVEHAARCEVDAVYVTDGEPPNPWGGLPGHLAALRRHLGAPRVRV